MMLLAESKAAGASALQSSHLSLSGAINHPGGDVLRLFLCLLLGMNGCWETLGCMRRFAAAGWEDGEATSAVVLTQLCRHPRQPEPGLGQE